MDFAIIMMMPCLEHRAPQHPMFESADTSKPGGPRRSATLSLLRVVPTQRRWPRGALARDQGRSLIIVVVVVVGGWGLGQALARRTKPLPSLCESVTGESPVEPDCRKLHRK